MKAGVAINPHTLFLFNRCAAGIDTVCMMSVNPGYGAQKFIPHTLSKIRELRRLIDNWNLPVLMEFDGGVTAGECQGYHCGSYDVLVAGNTVFQSKDPKEVILRN